MNPRDVRNQLGAKKIDEEEITDHEKVRKRDEEMYDEGYDRGYNQALEDAIKLIEEELMGYD